MSYCLITMSIPTFKTMAAACAEQERKVEDYFAVVKIKQGIIVKSIATYGDRRLAIRRLALENYYAKDKNDQNYRDKQEGMVFAIVVGMKVRLVRPPVS